MIMTNVLIRAGKCPAVLKSSSYEDVKEWIDIIDSYKKPDEDYQVSVYRYWARQQLRTDQDELEETLRMISEICNSNDTFFSLAMISGQ